MLMNRRTFVEKSLWTGGLLLAGRQFPPKSGLAREQEQSEITQPYHFAHQRCAQPAGPFSAVADGPQFAGQGGVVARASLIAKIRAEGK